MALQGTLDTFALPDVLRLLAATRKSGQLQVRGDRGAGSVWVTAGEVTQVTAEHAPLAVDPTEALFELLRFHEGTFTFDPDAVHDAGSPHEVEPLLESAEGLLAEWREVESIVPSLSCHVRLRRELAGPEVTIDQGTWTTIVAVGAGATVEAIGAHLELGELPVSRAVRDLVVEGLADLDEPAPDAPATASDEAEPDAEPDAEAGVEPESDAAQTEAEAQTESLRAAAPPVGAPVGAAPAAGTAHIPPPPPPPPPSPVGRFTALEPLAARPDPVADAAALPPLHLGPRPEAPPSWRSDASSAAGSVADEPATSEPLGHEAAPAAADELTGAFPGLANLSPRAAEAVVAAAEEPGGADTSGEAGEEPLNRGLLLKFLSSSTKT